MTAALVAASLSSDRTLCLSHSHAVLMSAPRALKKLLMAWIAVLTSEMT